MRSRIRVRVLDGEIVAFDAGGRPDFELLQRRFAAQNPRDIAVRQRAVPVVYLLFDVLFDGASTIDLPYAERRARLDASLAHEGAHWRISRYYSLPGQTMPEASLARGLEGVIAKRLDSVYESGWRSGAWIKIKHKREQEFVIGGYVRGDAHEIGSLLVGYYLL